MRSSDPEELDAFLEAHKPIASPATFKAGDDLGGWRITAFIGKGGSGEVYRAEHVASGTAAAIKIYIPRTGAEAARDALARARFLKEERFLAENAHPSFPRFWGFGECGDRPWYAMELLEERALPTRDADVAGFIIGVANGVRHLHSLGLVHRDIKPGNILWRGSLRCPVPVLVDFGLLKDTSAGHGHAGDSLSVIDGKAVVVGTPRYAAPEQLNGGEITPATDVYALGMLANECFGGRPPRAWARIIRRATAAIPAQRYSSIKSLIGTIRRRHFPRNAIIALTCLAIATVVWPMLKGRLSENGTSNDDHVGEANAQIVASERGAATEWSYLTQSVMSNGVIHSSIKLSSEHRDIVGAVELNAPQVVTVEGPGSITADVSGSSNVIIRLRKCEFRNTTQMAYPANAIRYELEGDDVDLVFSDQYYPTNCVRGALQTGPNFPGDTNDTRMLFRR